jgi:putative amino acid transporter
LITIGIGSSFSTVPIIATIYVPLCIHLGFSPMAIIALVGTAGALGDAGSPASDSTLGPTSGLNADGQHDHIWDSVVPTFIHYNIPLILFGWIDADTQKATSGSPFCCPSCATRPPACAGRGYPAGRR